MILADIRDYVATLGIGDHVYCGKMPDKEDKSIGVYNSKHQYPYHTAIGGAHLSSYKMRPITILVHWNTSVRDTEAAAVELHKKLAVARNATVNGETIIFWQLANDEPVDVGTDENGVYEMVIEAVAVIKKEATE